jgi:uncharacterized protein
MNTLSFLIKPASYLCNLDCSYCFYKKTETIYPDKKAFMPDETVEVLIQKALGYGAPMNSFCWQGGEPTLLGVDFYQKVVELQNRNRQTDQMVENSLQTNGLLLDNAWCDVLTQHHILVGLSLDGPREIHDRHRTSSNGKGSFQKVLHKVDLLRKHNVEFNILTLLTDANIRQPDELYTFFRSHDFNWLQFIPCFEHDPHTGDALPYTIKGADLGKFYCRMFDLWIKDGFPYVSVRLFEDILIYMLDGVHTACCWNNRCDSYIVVEHNGDCYPCDFFVDPDWKLGNICEDSLEAIMGSPLRDKFARMKSDIPHQCEDCRWKSFCNADCTRYRMNASGIYDRQSEFCVAWKMLLEHIQPRAGELAQRSANLRKAYQENGLETTPRNAPCPCGSGTKYKRCCGRGKDDNVRNIK